MVIHNAYYLIIYRIVESMSKGLNLTDLESSFGVPYSAISRANNGKCATVKYAPGNLNAKVCADGNTLRISGKYQDYVIPKLESRFVDPDDTYFFQKLEEEKMAGGARRSRKNRKTTRKNRKASRKASRKNRKVAKTVRRR